MALKEIFSLNETTTLYLWQLTEEVPELFKLAELTQEELHKYNTFTAKSRQREWLAIRALLNQIFNGKTQVTYNAMGKPFVDNGYHVSFSHCHKYVAVLTNTETPVGVDIELLNRRVLAVKDRVLTQTELGTLTKNAELQQVLVYWSLKEVLYKIARVGLIDFRKNIFLPPIDLNYPQKEMIGFIRKDGEQTSAKLSFILNDDWVIAWGMQTH